MALELPKPKVKMRSLAAADVIAHWRMEDASGTAVVDAAGTSNLTSTLSLNIVDGPFTGESSNKGRNFAGTSSATGASTAGQRTSLLGECTVEVWADLTSIAGNSTFIAHGSNAADATAANNTLLQFQAKASALQLVWEQGGGVNVIVNSNGDALTGLHHYAARRRATAGTYAVDFFVDGQLRSTTTGLTAPSGGTAGSWALGTHVDTTLSGGIVSGTVYEVRVAAVALSDEAIRDSWIRGVRDYDVATAIASGNYEVYGRARVLNASGVWIDVCSWYDHDWLEEMEWGGDVDDEGVSATLTLRREFGALSIAPLVTSSRPNTDDAAGRALDLTRQVKFDVAVVPAGTADVAGVAGHWQLAFHGFITGVSWPDGQVRLELADRFRALSRTFIEPNRATSPPTDFGPFGSTGGTAIEPELQSVVDTLQPASGYPGGKPTIFAPVISGWATREFWAPPDTSVGQLLQNKAAENGWLCAYVFDDARQEFRLTFFEPDRAKVWASGDPQIEPGQVLSVGRLELREDEIRNRIDVEHGFTTDVDSTGHIRRNTTLYVDTTSETRWGPLYARLGLPSNSGLNTATERDRLGNAALSDMKDPKAHYEPTVPFRWDLIVGDVVKFPADDLRFDGVNIFAVVGLRHKLDRKERTTTITCRSGAPIGRRAKWQDMFVNAGGKQKGAAFTPPKAPSGVICNAVANGASIRWDHPVNHGNRRYRHTEVHVSTVNGFTPSSSTLKKLADKSTTMLELPGNVTHYIRLVHRDFMANATAASTQVSVAPRYLPPSPFVLCRRGTTDLAIGASSPDDLIYDAVAAGTNAFGHYNNTTGVFTADRPCVVDVDANALYDAALKAGAQGRLLIRVDEGGGYVTRKTGATVTAVGTPTRAQLEVRGTVYLAVGDLLKVVIEQPTSGNAGSVVVNDDTASWMTITMIAES